ncbi:FMN-dependent NADH-azoreductase [Ectopseudomonas alcaliphila]|uniref:FMN-dependent NADH-azoreductase n=1 Tax=Ectopseudomonas alcaliphila TaxID=101564 RepID=UPI002788179E|nr:MULTISPECIES: NAD(P)H-dependent oxidoreductase [Pseudomonas]MDP9941031.1 FMN-dependent NADH-azoreductase [Pseudomonas sp. 3400]MDR7013250.1 FMN-dependent NADH-azoreductase [Pseudomonas alcaliphila]
MTTLLHLDASVRGERSLSRKLSKAFVQAWLAGDAQAQIIERDVGRNPPPFIDEAWIAAAFTAPEKRSAAQHEALRISDELIGEVERAEVIVLGTPMYNYGMPAALKAWFDQIIRVNKTFTFDLARGDYPLEPIMADKTLVILTSRGEFGFAPGGVREHMNHLETHIQTCAHYLGVARSHVVAIDYQEFGDARHKDSIAAAFESVSGLAAQLIDLHGMPMRASA